MAAKKKAALTPKANEGQDAQAPIKKPRKPRGNKGKTSSLPGESAHAHEWLQARLTQDEIKTLITPIEDELEPVFPDAGQKPRNPADHLAVHRIQPGQVLNPKGRPKGSRNKLGEQFIADLFADWEIHGASVITSVRSDMPDVYLKVVASILPKQMDIRVSEYDEMTDDQLDRRLKQLAADVLSLGGANVIDALKPN